MTASIRREWQRRLAVARSRNPLATGALASSMLRRQPFWRNRLQALAYEARFGLKGGRARTLRRVDQRHHLPWGPRFPGWQDAIAELDPIALQALQWRRSVEAAEAGLAGIPAQCQVTVFYEALVEAPEHELARIHHFLGVAPISEGGHGLAQPRRGGWRDQLGADEQARLEAAIGDKLDDLGYR